MLPNSRFYTGALLGTWMALGAMGQAYGALIADDFNEQPTTTPLPDTSQVVMDTTVPNAVGAGGYTNAALWTKFFRRGSLNTGITTTITEGGGSLTIATNNTMGVGISTNILPDLNFFNHGLQIMLRGVVFSGTAFPGHQNLSLVLTPYDPTTSSDNFTITLNANQFFDLSRYQWGVTPANNPYLTRGVKVPESIGNVDVHINDTRYEVIFYWNGGAIYYCGEHGLKLNAGAGLTWFNAQGDNLLELVARYGGGSNSNTDATKVSIDSVTVSNWTAPPVDQSLCRVPVPQ